MRSDDKAPEKTARNINSVYIQMLVIVIAFALMGISSFLFVSDIERGHLVKDAEDALAYTDAEITTSLLEPETFLSGYSETVRSMIMRGDTVGMVTAYMQDITAYMFDQMDGFTGTYGFFEAFNGGTYLSGRDWTPPSTYVAQERPWYKAAVKANGTVTITEPYINALEGNIIFTFSRRLFDDNGRPLGVICLDIDLNRILNLSIDIKLTPRSYSLLLNDELAVIAHPNEYYLGQPLIGIISGLADLADELKSGEIISERRVRNYLDEKSVVFFRKIIYDWQLGVVVPVAEYYKNINYMAMFLVALGSLLALTLCVMLYRISEAKKKSDLRTQQKSNFLATMSHEIRTPLNAILGITEIQLQNLALQQDTREAFAKLYNSGDLLLSIINDILDLSKIEAGKLELTTAKYDVASMINDVVQLNTIRYESKPVAFKLAVDENIPSTLVGDELRIKQILNNLLSNAFKYTEHGEVSLSVNAECVGRGGAVLVTLIFIISDTGQGMTAEQVRKLFDEYTRFNLEANRTTEGTGLGMTITRNLADLMYGKISVKSVVGEGTSVTVRLPQRTYGIGIGGVIGKELANNLQQFQLGNALHVKKTQIKYEPMPYGRVLIVDDVESNIYVAKGLMTPYSLKIDIAVSGFEAIDKIKEGIVYDIIFMDHMMPKMDGIETTKLIRNMGYTQPIIALTANALAGQAEVFIKNGFDGFISKPIDLRHLNSFLNRLIRDKQPADVIEAAYRERAQQEKRRSTEKPQQLIGSQLAEIFARDAEKALAVIDTALQNNFSENNDVQMFIINVHAIKSALANIGEAELSAVALTLEQAGRDGDIDLIRDQTQGFLDSLRMVVNKVKPMDSTGKDVDTNVEDAADEGRAYLREKLQIIKDACAAFDKKTAKKILSELREKLWSQKTKEQLNTIGEHMLHSEFDEAAAIVDDFIKSMTSDK